MRRHRSDAWRPFFMTKRASEDELIAVGGKESSEKAEEEEEEEEEEVDDDVVDGAVEDAAPEIGFDADEEGLGSVALTVAEVAAAEFDFDVTES